MTIALYERDFYAWTQRQADLLRNEEYTDLDRDNLIEEIKAMGRSQKRELRSRARVLLTHLLKLNRQRNGAPTRGWRLTAREPRRELADELADSPSLWQFFVDQLPDIYQAAREDAAVAMNAPIAEFPTRCPWTPEQILDLNWHP